VATTPGSRPGALQDPEAAGPTGSRGCVSQGRPGLAGVAFPAVYQPTALIAGERGPVIIEPSRAATNKPAGEKRLEVVPGASCQFDEPRPLDCTAGVPEPGSPGF
jgi:hypothetical protein